MDMMCRQLDGWNEVYTYFKEERETVSSRKKEPGKEDDVVYSRCIYLYIYFQLKKNLNKKGFFMFQIMHAYFGKIISFTVTKKR